MGGRGSSNPQSGGGGNGLSVLKGFDPQSASPAKMERAYNALVTELERVRAEDKEAAKKLYDMPTRSKAQKAAYEEANSKYTQMLRREYQLITLMSAVERTAENRGMLEVKTEKTGRRVGSDMHAETRTVRKWKRSGKTL